MTDDGVITNRMLLEHQQAMKSEFSLRIGRLERKVDQGFASVDRRFFEVDRRFEEAGQHRQALQEDLEATIQMQSTHQKKIAVLAGEQLPEEY